MRARSRVWTPQAAVLLVVVATIGTVGTVRSATAGGQPDPDPQLRRGAAVFQATCAACHGTSAAGRPGAGPALTDVPVAYVDLVLRTGRMPIPAPELGVRTDELDDDDREALVAWMRDRFELPGTVPVVGDGDAARGLAPFVRHCAACHGAGGSGGVAGGGTFVPPVHDSDPVTVVEALRVGPFEMPAFSERVIADDTAADIAAYLAAADDSPPTLLGLRALDPIGAGVAAAALLIAAVAVLRSVARRPDRGGDP